VTEARACRLLGEAFVGLAVGLIWPFVMIVLAFVLWGERTIAVGLFIAAMVAIVFISPGSLPAKLRSSAIAAAVGLSLINEAVFMPNTIGVLAAGSCLAMGAILLAVTPSTWDDAD
jgi:riboflavin transporter FmnP